VDQLLAAIGRIANDRAYLNRTNLVCRHQVDQAFHNAEESVHRVLEKLKDAEFAYTTD
jgi:lactam utilization protein B